MEPFVWWDIGVDGQQRKWDSDKQGFVLCIEPYRTDFIEFIQQQNLPYAHSTLHIDLEAEHILRTDVFLSQTLRLIIRGI